MECPRCLFTDDIKGVKIKKVLDFGSGSSFFDQCNYCDLHDQLEMEYSASPERYSELIDSIKYRGRNNRYDCLIGISGGFDSSLMLVSLVNNGVRPLAVHYDNGFNAPEAEHNMRTIVNKTGVDFLNVSISRRDFLNCSLKVLAAGVSDADIVNDMAMARVFVDVAKQYKIKSLINGHNFRTEGSSPIGWSYMDARYIKSICGNTGNIPLLTMTDQLLQPLDGTKTYRPLYLLNPDAEKRRLELESYYGWKSYGGKHCENIYTEFVGCYLLPRKFNIDKRRTYLSASIRCGKITKAQAKKELEKPIEYSEEKLEQWLKMTGVRKDELERIMNGPKHTFLEHETYYDSFKRYRWLWWLMMKAGVVARTFYTKYTREI
jgi:hypothetical protein